MAYFHDSQAIPLILGLVQIIASDQNTRFGFTLVAMSKLALLCSAYMINNGVYAGLKILKIAMSSSCVTLDRIWSM